MKARIFLNYINWYLIKFIFISFLLLVSCKDQEYNLNQYLADNVIPNKNISIFIGTKDKLCNSCLKVVFNHISYLTQSFDEKTLNDNINLIIIGASKKDIELSFPKKLYNKPYVYYELSNDYLFKKIVSDKPRIYFVKNDEVSFIDVHENNFEECKAKLLQRLNKN